jgi:hypothetical protein
MCHLEQNIYVIVAKKSFHINPSNASMKQKKISFLLHRSKNGLNTTQTRLAGDLTGNLAGDLVAK